MYAVYTKQQCILLYQSAGFNTRRGLTLFLRHNAINENSLNVVKGFITCRGVSGMRATFYISANILYNKTSKASVHAMKD